MPTFRLTLDDRLRLACFAGFCLTALSCAGPNAMAAQAPRLEFSGLVGEGREGAARRLLHPPVVLHLRAGDRLPVELYVDSALVQLESESMELLAKRDFYILLRPNKMPLLSEDGVDFKKRPHGNYFFLGLGVTKKEGPRFQVRLGIRPEEAEMR